LVLSILSNGTLWPLLWLALEPSRGVLADTSIFTLLRLLSALDLQHRLTRFWSHLPFAWLVPVRDLLQALLWLGAFLGSTVEWRRHRLRLGPARTLERGARTNNSAL